VLFHYYLFKTYFFSAVIKGIVLFGPQHAGKSTQAQLLSQGKTYYHNDWLLFVFHTLVVFFSSSPFPHGEVKTSHIHFAIQQEQRQTEQEGRIMRRVPFVLSLCNPSFVFFLSIENKISQVLENQVPLSIYGSMIFFWPKYFLAAILPTIFYNWAGVKKSFRLETKKKKKKKKITRKRSFIGQNEGKKQKNQ
jgi:hypothetical protein